jgi:hypothetical protein
MFSDTWFEPLESFAAGIAARDGCSLEKASVVARELADLHPQLQSAFRKWWETGEVPDDCIAHGFTPKRLIDEGWCKTVAVAFTWLDGLTKRPKDAMRLLRRGRDYISPPPNEWVREDAAGDGSGHSKG